MSTTTSMKLAQMQQSVRSVCVCVPVRVKRREHDHVEDVGERHVDVVEDATVHAAEEGEDAALGRHL